MTASNTHAKKRGPKQTSSERKAAIAEANRKAQLQWYAIGFAAVALVGGAIVLISLLTEGELPLYGGHGG